jgi:hypothetical protein
VRHLKTETVLVKPELILQFVWDVFCFSDFLWGGPLGVFVPLRAHEHGFAEVGITEVGIAEVSLEEVASEEVGTTEVGTAEVGTF